MVDSGSFSTSETLRSAERLRNFRTGDVLKNASDGETYARRNIDPSKELGQLNVCFGGFSPTVMQDISDTFESLLNIQRIFDERKSANKASSGIDVSSKIGSDAQSINGALWKYSILRDETIIIDRCDANSDIKHLIIPEELDGKPVVALAAEACSKIEQIESIFIPNSISFIGSCAFRDCPSLERIEFPSLMDAYDSTWLRGCSSIKEIKLPGLLDRLTPSLFDIEGLQKLEIGPGTGALLPGTFCKSHLSSIAVDAENEYIATDGCAIYSKDFSVLMALAVPADDYKVASECKVLAKKAFSLFENVKEVHLPETLEIIGDYAFSKCAISSFHAPKSLLAIGERAFFGCENLSEVALDKNLISIGAHAFSDTSIKELRLPSSIMELGNPIADGVALTYSGNNATFSIESGPDQKMFLDESGAIYFKEDDGLHLIRMLDRDIESFTVSDDTVAIDEKAFAKHPSLRSIELNEGLLRIGESAFKGCRNLEHVKLPSSIERIGDEAFLDTSLKELKIPEALNRIGAIALITYGSHHGSVEPSLRHIEVAEDNAKYYMESGLLIERMENGSDRVILCTGEIADVVIPDSVSAIASYAFNGARRLKSLVVSDKVVAIDVRGLAFDSLLESLRVNVQEPIFGHDHFDFNFPNTSRAAQQMSLAFGSPNFIDVAPIFDSYDNSIVSRTGFGGAEEEKMGSYEQGKRIVERLKEPIFMTTTNKGLMESALKSHIEQICIDTAKHDDKDLICGLLDLGFINSENIEMIIESVGRIQDASMTNYLLEQKQRRFGDTSLDFEL